MSEPVHNEVGSKRIKHASNVAYPTICLKENAMEQSSAVRSTLHRTRTKSRLPYPRCVSLGIGHHAEHAASATALVARRVALAAFVATESAPQLAIDWIGASIEIMFSGPIR